MLLTLQPPVVPIDWRKLVKLPPAELFPADTVIAQQRQPAAQVFFLDHGLLKITRKDSSGDEHVLNLISTPGQVLCAGCIILNNHMVSCTTMIDTRLHQLPAAQFVEMLHQDAALSWKLHQVQSREQLMLLTLNANKRHLTVRERMEQLLCHLIYPLCATSRRQDIKLKLPLKYTEIARFFSVSPEHLSRVIKQMTADGVIRRERDKIVVPDPASLCLDYGFA